jgi:hypothetical protein
MENWMFFSIRNKISKSWFDWRVRKVFNTKTAKCNPHSNLIILSQLYHPDLAMFMVAAKSFAQYVTPKKYVIVDDGLTEADRAILRQHFEVIDFIRTEQVDTGLCPKRGCWERLISIANLNAEHYIIQLDADTLTLAEPTEVLTHLKNSHAFTLGTPGGQTVTSLAEASHTASGYGFDHVQVLAEQALVKLPPELGTLYVHGCAGFAGFAPGCITRGAIEAFSTAMTDLLGNKKWSEWGSEQVTSNFIVANTPHAGILAVMTYPFWQPDIDISKAKFFHFFGTHRFEGGEYIRSSNKVINGLIHHQQV